MFDLFRLVHGYIHCCILVFSNLNELKLFFFCNISLFILEVVLDNGNIISFRHKLKAFRGHQPVMGFEPVSRGHICYSARHANHSATGQGHQIVLYITCIIYVYIKY